MKLTLIHKKHGDQTTEITMENAIEEIEKAMNELGGKERSAVLVADPPDAGAVHLDLDKVPTLSQDAVIYVQPVIVGG